MAGTRQPPAGHDSSKRLSSESARPFMPRSPIPKSPTDTSSPSPSSVHVEALSLSERRPGNHSRNSSLTGFTVGTVESRGRRSSSSASARNQFKAPMRGPSTEPTKFPAPMNNAEIYDTMEKEQEAIVNKLQREITTLRSERSRSRSQSTSSSSSVSRHASIRSVYSISDAEELASRPGAYRSSRPSFGAVAGAPPPIDDTSLIVSLRKENELLKKKLADLNVKVAEKDAEIKRLGGAV